MLREIWKFLYSHSILIAFAILLLYLVFDPKAVERLRTKTGKIVMLFTIAWIIIFLVIGVIKRLMDTGFV